MSAHDPAAFDAQVEALTLALERTPDAEALRSARDLIRLVLELHGDGLRRMLEILAPESDARRQRLLQDPVVAGLFALHGIDSPDAPGGRVPAPTPSPLIQIRRPSTASTAPAMRAHDEGRPQCDACGEPLGDPHHHAVDLVTRQLSCSCRACWLLLGGQAASGSRRPVPDRYLAGAGFRLTAAQWDALQVPVGTAFFMHNSVIGRTIAFYPSPAGATESSLSLAAWREVEDANPWVRTAAPDVEAILVRGNHVDAEYDAFIVPVDACYDLVGRLRMRGAGLDGGFGAQAEIERFISDVAARSRQAAGSAASRP